MKIVIRSLMIMIMLTFVIAAQQDKSEVVENALSKLKQKVLLTDDQVSKVKAILTSNLTNLQNASTQNKALLDSKTRVESLLDSRQKAKYSIIKDDWWNNLVKDLGT